MRLNKSIVINFLLVIIIIIILLVENHKTSMVPASQSPELAKELRSFKNEKKIQLENTKLLQEISALKEEIHTILNYDYPVNEIKSVTRIVASVRPKCKDSLEFKECVNRNKQKWDKTCVNKSDQEVKSNFYSTEKQPDQYTKIEEEVIQVTVLPVKDFDLCQYDRTQIHKFCREKICGE